MGLQKIILNFILKIESLFVLLFPIKGNRVTFISLESAKLASDFKLIYEQLDKLQYDIQLCLIHYHKNLFGQFLYFLNCMKQLYLINTSRVVILHDNNYVVSHFKRKGVIVLQVWHACGAIKKFGNVIERQYPISNYDYVLATSSYWQQAYHQAFSVSTDHVLPIGLPRTDELFHQEWIKGSQERLYIQYPQLKNKKVVLYAPTFRGNIYKGFTAIDFQAQQLMNALGDEYVLIYKFHPLLGNYQLNGDQRIINMNHEDTHALLSLCDYLISDYSSIIFDYMILEKPLIFFTPDLENYIQSIGVFVNIYDLKCPVCHSVEEVIKAIQNHSFDKTQMKKMKNVFFDNQDGQSTQRVVAFLNQQLKS